MHAAQTVCAQIFEFVSHKEFQRCVERDEGNRPVRRSALIACPYVIGACRE
jgi:hypothetical protein